MQTNCHPTFTQLGTLIETKTRYTLELNKQHFFFKTPQQKYALHVTTVEYCTNQALYIMRLFTI